MAAERELNNDKISKDLELSALLEEQQAGYECATGYTNSGFEVLDFPTFDNFSDMTEAQPELRSYTKNPTSCENTVQKCDIKKETSNLAIPPQTSCAENSRSIGNPGVDQIDEILDELLSCLDQDRNLSESSKPKKPRITDNSEEFAIPKVYACHYCSATFYNKMACHHHQVCHAKKTLRCRYCSKRSRSYSELERHMEYLHGIPQKTKKVL